MRPRSPQIEELLVWRASVCWPSPRGVFLGMQRSKGKGEVQADAVACLAIPASAQGASGALQSSLRLHDEGTQRPEIVWP